MDTNMQHIMQQEVERRLRETGRENVEELITFLADNGYYTAHCHRHHRFEGGTAQHCVETLLYALSHNTYHVPEESLTIVCLLHDLCDIHGFDQYERHGSRSCNLITKEAHFILTDDERLAILHHMHHHDEPTKFGRDYDRVTSMPLWKTLRAADHYSAGHVLSRYELAAKVQ